MDAALEPFGGRFVVHGGNVEVAEGGWGSDVIVIEFPDRERVRAWYDSPACREVLPLRTRQPVADAIFADGCPRVTGARTRRRTERRRGARG
ncbi:DUF1330 domain-containing protein [Kitasatospora sp. NPDC101157]|uniref:DUF1330 domain-containing protein n=1 Tax=Kitasatospora sp. NPDC101157 TaxID=3364098 RepID=UPI0038281964